MKLGTVFDISMLKFLRTCELIHLVCVMFLLVRLGLNWTLVLPYTGKLIMLQKLLLAVDGASYEDRSVLFTLF